MESVREEDFINKKPDGTVKQINPFTHNEIWTVPGRAGRPLANAQPAALVPLARHAEDDYCDFCYKNYLETPPEKSRIVVENGKYIEKQFVPVSELYHSRALFRRIPNLFEIVSYDYWARNFNYKLPPRLAQWRDAYLADKAGCEHVLKIVSKKLQLQGHSPDEVEAIGESEKLAIGDAFFGGCHEVIVVDRHYAADARYESDLFSSGSMTPDEHFHYCSFVINSLRNLFDNNRYVRYVSVFQNWLRPGGASFDHLHKQLVAIDEWGTSIERELELVRSDINIYNTKALNYACYHNLVIAENDHAVAFADFGHRYPTVAIYSKSVSTHPWALLAEELRGFSDIVHAVHAAMGPSIPCNEEWYYQPIDAIYPLPWHILIKWRVTTLAGFEGGTKIYVNTLSPEEIRNQLVPQLFDLRYRGKIAPFAIAMECPCKANSLKYYKSCRT
jgi:galactose-1-phosphate uridylyltransferase